MRAYWLTLAALLALFAPAFAQVSEQEYAKEMDKSVKLLQAGKYEEGTAGLKHCLELAPNEPIAAYNLACAYSLQKQTDTAFEWFDKGMVWGFGFCQTQNLTFPDNDKDLDSIRADPRYAQAMDKMKAMAKAAEEVYSKPVVYIPEAIKEAPTMPLLVVLHDYGQTAAGAFEKGPWKKLADELGSALILPSAKVPTKLVPEFAPKEGMAWFGAGYSSFSDYQTNYWRYEKTVADAVTAFKKEHKLEPTRVFIAGEGQGGTVAFNVALFSPGLYKGVVALSGVPILRLAETKLPTAAKMGMKVALVWDKAEVYLLGKDAAQIESVATNLEGGFKKSGLTATITRFDRKADDPEQIHGLLKTALDGLAAPAATPAPVEAGTTNK